MTRRTCSAAILLITLLAHSDAFAQRPHLRAEGHAEISAFLREAVETGEVPAVEAVVFNRDGVLFHEVFGQRSSGAAVPLRKGDLFDIASMTKPVTGIAAMVLHDDGKLGLDESVSSRIPEFADFRVMTAFDREDTTYASVPPEPPIAVRHLLTQTSGMAYPFLAEELGLLFAKHIGGEVPFVYDYFQLPLLYHPGDDWSYGISYQALGTLVEEVSGLGLDEFFRQRIFGPLGMDNTFYDVPEDKLDRRVTLHVRQEDGGWVEQELPERPEVLVIGDATLFSTGADYARLLRMLLNGGTLDGTRILSEATVRMMTQNQIGDLTVHELFNEFPPRAERDGFGFGFRVTRTDQDTPYGRAAGSYSWAGSSNTYFWVDPERGIGVVLLMQYWPFHRERTRTFLGDFERTVYRSLRREADEGFVNAGDGVRLFYRAVGTATDTLIIVHGGPGFDMEYFAADLEPLADDLTLIFYDQRGAGRSTLVGDSAALAATAFADDLEAIRTHFGLEQLNILGHSWGAGVAALYATRHPDRVDRLVIVSGLPLHREPLVTGFRAMQANRDSSEINRMEDLYSALVADPGDAARCREYYALWFRPFYGVPGTAAETRGDFCAATAEARANGFAYVDRFTMASLGEWDWRSSLRDMQAPALIIHGTEDPIPYRAAQEWSSTLPNSRLLLLDGIGHFPYLEAPARFFPSVTQFVTGEH